MMGEGSTQECLISYSDNAHRRRSSFIDELALEGVNIVETTGNAAEALSFAPYPSPTTPYIEGVEVVAKTPEILAKAAAIRYSPTSIDTYNNCPMRFYYQYILGLREANGEVSEGIEPNEIGTALHKLMESVTVEEVAGMDVEAFARLFDPQALNLPISHLQPWDKLKIDADTYDVPYDIHKIMTKRHADGFATIDTELDLSTMFHGYTLRGIVDRVEGTPERVDIIDFKYKKKSNIDSVTAKALKKAQEEGDYSGVKSYQHCVYAVLVRDYLKGKGDLRPIHGLYFMVIRERGVMVEYLPSKKGQTLADIELGLETMEGGLKELLDEINDPDTPFTKAEKISACQYCPYKLPCGRGL